MDLPPHDATPGGGAATEGMEWEYQGVLLAISRVSYARNSPPLTIVFVFYWNLYIFHFMRNTGEYSTDYMTFSHWPVIGNSKLCSPHLFQ